MKYNNQLAHKHFYRNEEIKLDLNIYIQNIWMKIFLLTIELDWINWVKKNEN